MKLQIGKRLKMLRSMRGTTQEKLAEALGVSSQSVSRWEMDVCYPDIELLPAIANYFEVTLDDLMGMPDLRSEETKNAIFTEALNLERAGDWRGAVHVLRRAVAVYPTDNALLAELALALSHESDRSCLLEAITLSEEILSRCANEKIRSTVRANLCFLYKSTGQAEKALALGRTLPHIWECREVLLPGLVPNERRAAETSRSLNIAHQVLHDLTEGNAVPFSLGYAPVD